MSTRQWGQRKAVNRQVAWWCSSTQSLVDNALANRKPVKYTQDNVDVVKLLGLCCDTSCRVLKSLQLLQQAVVHTVQLTVAVIWMAAYERKHTHLCCLDVQWWSDLPELTQVEKARPREWYDVTWRGHLLTGCRWWRRCSWRTMRNWLCCPAAVTRSRTTCSVAARYQASRAGSFSAICCSSRHQYCQCTR